MSKRICLFFSLLMISLFFVACTSKEVEVDGAVGKYYFVFEKGPMHYYEDLDYVMIIDGKGGGEWIREENTHKIKYTFNDPEIKIEDKLTGIKYKGTVVDGQLHLYDGDPSDTMTSEYLFEVNR